VKSIRKEFAVWAAFAVRSVGDELCPADDDEDDNDAGHDPPPVASAIRDGSKSGLKEFLLAAMSTVGAHAPACRWPWSFL
jgi:hypothetical protein